MPRALVRVSGRTPPVPARAAAQHAVPALVPDSGTTKAPGPPQGPWIRCQAAAGRASAGAAAHYYSRKVSLRRNVALLHSRPRAGHPRQRYLQPTRATTPAPRRL
jgi:hypothetical protein